MLVVTRKQGERVRIELNPSFDPSTPVGELFIGGPIEVVVTRVTGSNVRLGIRAHPALLILRDELGP